MFGLAIVDIRVFIWCKSTLIPIVIIIPQGPYKPVFVIFLSPFPISFLCDNTFFQRIYRVYPQMCTTLRQSHAY